MKWKYYNNRWHDENHNPGTPAGSPPENPKNGKTTYDDGVSSFKPPSGYNPTPVNCLGGSQYVWLMDPFGYLPSGSSVALEHLIAGAYGVRGQGGWHKSTVMKGASGYYVHPSKKDSTLYLIDDNGGATYDNGNGRRIPMIEVKQTGKVKDGVHKF